MMMYQIHRRVFRVPEGEIIFPNQVEINFMFLPKQPFGTGTGDGKTVLRAVAATMEMNMNTGKYFAVSEIPLEPLHVVVKDSAYPLVELLGNELHVHTECSSLEELNRVIETVYYLMPVLLNVELVDPPIIDMVSGRVGDVHFQWQLAQWKVELETTTQDRQSNRIREAFREFEWLCQPTNRRLVAALHYFHQACRLINAGYSPWEFMSEALLDLNKVLEVLFPPSGDGKGHDAVRVGLKQLGYSEAEIERHFIPTMLLRNEIDVGHVDLSVFTLDQLQTIHQYTSLMEKVFRSMLRRVIEQARSGQFQAPAHSDLAARKEATKIIENLRKHMQEKN